MCKTRFQIINEGFGSVTIPIAHQPERNKLGIGTSGRPCPHIPISELTLLVVLYVLLFGVAKGPNLVTMDVLARQVSHDTVLIG